MQFAASGMTRFPKRLMPQSVLLGSVLGLLLASSQIACAQTAKLDAFSTGKTGQAPASWRAVGLPDGKAPLARFDLVPLEGRSVLRLSTDKSYGSLVHDLKRMIPGANTTLAWRWRLDLPLAHADLRIKTGDDAALKVCVLYDMPTDGLPFTERALLGMARQVSGERLPAATLCYIWDPRLVVGTIIDNPYSSRLKYWVLDGQGGASTGRGIWTSHQRNIGQDFLRAFGHESAVVPPVEAVAVGADSDNTGGTSLGFMGDINLTP
jgi:Protein of unknown function (DUF3047)